MDCMKILLSVYACHPNRGSEPGVGWGWLQELSRKNEVWALFYAEQGQREAVIEAVGKLPYRPNVHLIPMSVPKFFQNRFYRARYEIWQWEAYQFAQKLARDVQFDLVHHVTIAAWWNCGHLWKLNIPFVF